MSEAGNEKADMPTRRGGLGRGLGALIPSAPLGNASGKGHFWSALDNPPAVDDDAKKRALDEATARKLHQRDADSRDESAGQGDDRALQTAGHDVSAAAEGTDQAPVDEVVDERESVAEVSRETVQSRGEVAVLVELDPNDIRPNPKNPRQVFDDDELAELSASIAEFGLLQPIVVRETNEGYELIMGERRLRASKLAGIDRIPVIVRQTDDDAMLRDALLENIHRVQLHPLEEAAAYQQLIDEFGVTHDELAQRIKRSRPAISNTIRLLKLPTRVQNRVAAGVISGSHARALLSLDDSDDQEALATRIVAEGLSVRATEELVTMHADDGGPKRRAPRRRTVTAPALGALADKLSDHFDTRALVQLGRSKGKIVVEFASIDDLERIVAMMAPPLATVRLDSAPPVATDSEPDEG